MTTSNAADVAARLDRLPPSRHVWTMLLLLSFGGIFEFYDLFVTGYVGPGMLSAGMLTPSSLGILNVLEPLGVEGLGTFVFATFAGLFVGSILLGSAADRLGRRTIFVGSLLWYSVTTFIMALMPSGFWIDIWRFIAGVGIGVELVTIDTYISELVPRHERGRAFAVSQFVAFMAVPLVALLAWLLVPATPFGLDGWRWVVLIGSSGALVVFFIQRGVPESPRWLARHGRNAEAERVTAAIEAAVMRETEMPLPAPSVATEETTGTGSYAEIWSPRYRRRTIMLSLFNFFQTIGFYGFAAWVPTLLIAKGIDVTRGLEYSFIIAIANPIGPLLGVLVADRMERKWQIVAAAVLIAVFGMAFAQQTSAVALIVLGVMITLSNNWMSFAYHNYQAEVFPTRVRARAVGFVYSWSRLSAAFAGLFISYLLHAGGAATVFLFIAFAMAMVVGVIGLMGPRTRGRSLEEIAR
ncbi:MAG TPA: MFS transporter [Stellaceae bacterium]|jgi:putative MFS transporter|nr:MFS transporter [Stellaceae bacterium]